MKKFIKAFAVGVFVIYCIVKVWIWSSPILCAVLYQIWSIYDCSKGGDLYLSPLIFVIIVWVSYGIGWLIMSAIDPSEYDLK